MNTRSKLIAAALGLIVATGAIGEASAKTITATRTITATKTVKPIKMVKTVKVAGHHRIHLAHRGVKHVTLAHRLTPRVKIARKVIGKPVAKVTMMKSRLVGTQSNAMIHRSVAKTTVVR